MDTREMAAAHQKKHTPANQPDRLLGIAACIKAGAWPVVFLILGLYYSTTPLPLSLKMLVPLIK
jgi:hypothetical protein